MIDPLSTGPVRPAGPSGDADREARIEQLLLAGLDHYFAGEYERAISVWTRVVFLERHHDRARAYIERARSAMAEGQREADELLGGGIAAYNAGDVDAARDLLTRAADRGSDTAHLFLDRLHRIGHPAAVARDVMPIADRRMSTARRPANTRSGALWTVAGALAVVAVVAVALAGMPGESSVSPAPAVAQAAPPDPLPVVRASEMALVRARTLYEAGRLHDAIRTLDTVGTADPYRRDADRLKADIQRDLLAAAGVPDVPPPVVGTRP